ncbi:haloacid dehalogenase [Pedobacter hiemivivus]|uniref:Haloacid dehalogenase n=1 Tax=Pedobacter hiemivivus TaxID=2530454 RepID=A0A4U1GMF8_9SPHI|nr:HAD hydrolase-like protein [Pedobacter hiemivivus]TKC65617.1 haloacid dehalogenase [Pedobacter hiemivivus]
MIFEKYLQEKDSFFFELDNVIFPEKDYFLQVYYLFAQFMEYGEQLNAADVLKYMQETYEKASADDIFAKTAEKFNIPEKYKINFDMLLHSARLPLKLLIYNEVLNFLQSIVLERKQIFLLVSGNPTTQLNKIKQTEWNGLEKYLTVFFTEEFEPEQDALKLIIEKQELKKERVLLIGNSKFAKSSALKYKMDYLDVNELFKV